MTELIWKDIVAARWFLAILIPFYLLQLAATVSQAPIFYLFTLLFTILLAFGSIGLEDHHGTESLWCSLPVTRRHVVLARYLSTGLGVFLGLAMSWLVGQGVMRLAVMRAVLNSGQPPGLQGYAALFILLALLSAVFLPCYFRLGAGKGLIVFSAIGVALLIVIPLLLQLVFFLAGYSNPLLDPELLRRRAAEMGTAQRERLAHLAMGVMTVLAMAATLLSAGLSVRFYEKRDL
jgi:ABC-type transport system involved in multi-copper enzyme maturation permease subunit